jgi:hypothetical protein
MPPARRGLRCHHVIHGTERATHQERLQCCHVPRGTEPVTWQGRALESPRASWLQARLLRSKALALPHDQDTRTIARQGSGTTMCPVAPGPPPGAGGLRSRHMPSGSQPPGRACAFLRCMISGPSWPRQAHSVGSALNVYVTCHTQCMAGIKCVQNIDTVVHR